MRHWNNTGKRGLALFLALLMCLNLLSLSALAANVDPEIPPTAEEGPLETTDGSKSEDPDDPEQGEEEKNPEGSEDPAPPADNEEPSSDTPEDGPEDKSPAEEDPGQNDQDEPEEPVAEDPAQDEPEEPVTEAPKMGPAKQKASRTDSGWEQDPQTVKGDSSDAVCEDVSGDIHLKAQTGSGNGRGTDTSNWPTVFVNEKVNAALAAAKAGDTCFVEMAFTPLADTYYNPFGVFINYADPGNGLAIVYDWSGGWYWQVCTTSGNEPYYMGKRVSDPTVNEEITLRIEWRDNVLTKATVDGENLFGEDLNVDFSANTGTGFGFRCSQSSEVTISSFKYGVVGSEEPNPPAVEKPAAPTTQQISAAGIFGVDVWCGNDSTYNKDHWLSISGYDIGEVTANEGSDKAAYPYLCEVRSSHTVEELIATFNAHTDGAKGSFAGHVRDTVRGPQDPVATLYYNAETKGWELLTNDGRNSSLRPYGNQYFLTIWVDRYATYTWETADGTQTKKVSLCKAVQDTVADPAAYTKDGKEYTFVEWTAGTDELGNPTYTARYDEKDVPPPVDYDGECGAVTGTVFYKRTGNEVRIWGEGAMKTFGSWSDKSPWYGDESITSVVIDQGVTSVGANAFMNCKNITSVSIPSSVTTIGYYAFYQTKLTDVVIPEGVTSIEFSAFADCYELSSVSLPNSLMTIGSSAFKRTALTSVTIPDGVTEIQKETFWTCKQLVNVKLPANLTTIGVEAFRNCTVLGAVELPETVTTISKNAFYESGLTSINIPAGVTKIDEGVFHCCKNLTQIELPEDVTEIGYLAFRETGLTSIVIPEGVTKIGEQAFLYCKQLHSVVFEGNPTVHSGAFSTKSGLTRIHYYVADGAATDPNAYNAILNGGTIPAGTVFQQGTLATPTKEGFVFQGWYNGETALEKDGDVYTIPDGTAAGTTFTAKWTEETPEPTYTAQGECGKVEGTVFYGLTADGVLHIWGQGEMKDYSELSGGKPYPNDKRAPWLALGLKYNSVVIEEGVTSIGNYAFQKVDAKYNPPEINLTSVSLPSTLTHIGNWAFKNSGLNGQTIKIPDSVTSMGTRAFIGTGIVGVELSTGMKYVPDYTFSGCKQLTNVTIPEGTLSIGECAFSNCSSLTDIKLPDSLVTIKNSGFKQSGLTSITLPKSVTTIYGFAFSGCTNLTKVDLGNVKNLNSGVFQDCTALESVTLPDTLKELYNTMFWKTGISSITIPDGVVIKSQAFDMMTSLRNIVLLGTPKLAGSNGGSFGWMNRMSEDLIIYAGNSDVADAVAKEALIGVVPPSDKDKADSVFYYIANLDGGTLSKEVAPGKLAPAEKEGFVFQGWKAADGTALTAGEDGYYAIPAGTARGTVYTAQWTEKVEYVAEGNCGLWPHVEDVHYQLTADGALRIWGKGKMNNWTHASDVPWDKLNVTSVVVEKGVTSIGQNAFNAYKSFVESPIKLTSVTLPETLETIGPAAFKFCAELEQVSIPEGVTEIGAEAFSGCKKLNNVTLPQGLTEIANNAFSNCQAFTSVTLPENVTKIGSGAFSGCKDLKDLELNGVTEIGNSAFYGCASITGMTLPEGLTQLNDQTFGKSGVTSVTIPAGVKFSNYPFKEATALQNVVFLGAPSSEGSGSFYGTKHTGTLIVYLCNSDANGLKAVQSLVGSNPSICIADANGGALAGAVIPGKLAPVSKADDIFLGWQTADGTMLNKDENGYYAIPENAETGTVYTALFGGFHTVTINGTEYTVKYGDKLSTVLPAKNPTRVGYTFQGWVDAEGNDVTADTVVTGDMTVTANWQVSTYTVTYVIDGETVKTAEYTYGSAVEPFSAPEKEGYTFIGWTGEPKTMPAEDVTVTGSYAVNTYTITVDGTEHTVEHGDKLSTVLPAENPTRVGYTFQGWVDAEGNEVTGDTPITGAMTVTPKWELNSYTVTVGEQKITVKHGESLGGNMPADPSRSGYEFSGWFTSESGGERITAETPITSDVTLHARWTYVGGGGTWTPSVPAPTPTPPLVEVEDPDVPLAELPLPFEDVADGDWYREAVAFMYKNDLMLGVSDKLFGVSTNTTRGMMATVIYRLEKEPGVAFEKVFNDVDNGKWFSQAITWANANGVAVGYDDNSFGPEDNVTREQLVTMLYRYAAKKGYDVSKQADLSAFVDAGRVSGYAREAMGWAVANGIIQGRGANTLAPTDLALRVEVATIFQRFAARYMTIETTA